MQMVMPPEASLLRRAREVGWTTVGNFVTNESFSLGILVNWKHDSKPVYLGTVTFRKKIDRYQRYQLTDYAVFSGSLLKASLETLQKRRVRLFLFQDGEAGYVLFLGTKEGTIAIANTHNYPPLKPLSSLLLKPSKMLLRSLAFQAVFRHTP